MGRMTQTLKTIKYSMLSQVVRIMLNFVSRTVFLWALGVEYSGVNGLFTNVLGVLSMSELGIGSAMIFALYKPVANGDMRKVKAIMHFYKKAYYGVACVIGVLGLIMVPFLPYIIKGGEALGFERLRVYYLIFLFNTVIGYFVSYKCSMLYAEQKTYVATNIDTVSTSVITVAQIIVLIFTKNFLFYLITASVLGACRQLYMNYHLNKMYPFLKEKHSERLTKEERKSITDNIKALIFHCVGTRAIGQTDNIVISAFINITVTGCVSFYLMLEHAVNSIVNTFTNSTVASLGNLIAKESVEKQESVIEKYIFITFWIMGVATLGLAFLMTPVVTIVWGEKITIGFGAVLCMVFSNYAQYQLGCLNYISEAAGLYVPTKYIPLVQTIVNLVVSVVLAIFIGIEGVYIGTIVQAVVAQVWKAKIMYKHVLHKGVMGYYINQLKYLGAIGIAFALCWILDIVLKSTGMNIILFAAIMFVAVLVITNLVFMACFGRSKEFKYVVDIGMGIVGKFIKKK